MAVTLTHLKPVTDRKGVVRWYFRAKGQKLIPMPQAPHDSAEFLAAYAAAKASCKVTAATPMRGTLAALCGSLMRSQPYSLHSEGYRAAMRRHIMAIEAKGGTALARDLRARHITADLAPLTPAVGQLRLKAWRMLCAHGVLIGAMTVDPSAEVKRPKMPKSDGHPPWTRDEVDAFREYWAIGTIARVVFEVIHWTGCRISDAVNLTQGMIDRDGILAYRQKKTKELAYVPWTCALPAHLSHLVADRVMMHDALRASNYQALLLIPTQDGAPRSSKAISGDVRAWARQAGVKKSAHGLRKSRAVALAEAGSSSHDIGAWTGHTSLAEIEHYTRAAEKRRAVMGTQERKAQ